MGPRSAARQPVGEMKYFDCSLEDSALAAVTTTWVAGTAKDPANTINLGSAAVATPLCLFAPTVGAALNQRIGRQVSMMKCRVAGTVSIINQAAQAATDTSSKIRIILVLDKQTNAAQMTGAQLQNDSGTNASTISSFQNPNNFGRFKVLKEKVLTLGDLNMTGSPTAADVIQAGVKRAFKMNYKFKTPVVVHFNATNGGTVADIIDNSLHVIAAADNITYAPLLSYYTRVAFKE